MAPGKELTDAKVVNDEEDLCLDYLQNLMRGRGRNRVPQLGGNPRRECRLVLEKFLVLVEKDPPQVDGIDESRNRATKVAWR
jgi:hypothetical protein